MASTRLQHQRDDRLTDEKVACEIGIEHPPPILFRVLKEWLYNSTPGIVRQDIDHPKAMSNFLCHVANLLGIANVRRNGKCQMSVAMTNTKCPSFGVDTSVAQYLPLATTFGNAKYLMSVVTPGRNPPIKHQF